MFDASWIQTDGKADEPVYAIVTPESSTTAGHDGSWSITNSDETVNEAVALTRSPHLMPANADASSDDDVTFTVRSAVNAGRVCV